MRAVEPSVAVELGPSPSTPGAARALVREHWTMQVQPEVLDVVGLCVSELVTNAIDHAQPPYWLRLTRRGHTLRIELDDATVDPPIVRSQHPLQARGRGMFLVDTLSRAWGVLPSGHGKTVWAEF
ncbi:MAG TPA: ATP-binding protein [Acidimicrobiales bacterium]|nr:ATP-binding protein [Acidimicrobiales bacterium]